MIKEKNKIALCVDLDKTLILTDSLYESFLLSIKKNPVVLIIFPFWLIKGKEYFKEKICEKVTLNIQKLSFNKRILEKIEEARKEKREVVLATASTQKIAEQIANHLQIFDKVESSRSNYNLKGKNKRDKLVEMYGKKGFDYAGDSFADIPIWQAANAAILVNPSKKLIKKVEQITKIDEIIYSN